MQQSRQTDLKNTTTFDFFQIESVMFMCKEPTQVEGQRFLKPTRCRNVGIGAQRKLNVAALISSLRDLVIGTKTGMIL